MCTWVDSRGVPLGVETHHRSRVLTTVGGLKCWFILSHCGMYTHTHPTMWAPSEPARKRVRVELSSPPDTPTKSIVIPTYQHTWIGVGSVTYDPKLGFKVLKFHPVPQTPDKLTEQLVIRK